MLLSIAYTCVELVNIQLNGNIEVFFARSATCGFTLTARTSTHGAIVYSDTPVSLGSVYDAIQ